MEQRIRQFNNEHGRGLQNGELVRPYWLGLCEWVRADVADNDNVGVVFPDDQPVVVAVSDGDPEWAAAERALAAGLAARVTGKGVDGILDAFQEILAPGLLQAIQLRLGTWVQLQAAAHASWRGCVRLRHWVRRSGCLRPSPIWASISGRSSYSGTS